MYFADINFRELKKFWFFASINFRELVIFQIFARINFRGCRLNKKNVILLTLQSTRNLKWAIRAIKTHSNKINTNRLGFWNIYMVFWRLSFLSSLSDKLSMLVLIFANFNCKKISRVLIFADLTSRNISRVFNFAKMAKKREIHEKIYPGKLVLLS